MSVVIVVKVSDGLVLAADSAATLTGRIEGPDGIQREGVLKTFYNAKKLIQIGDFPIGVLTWGTASIGPRTVESLIRKWGYDKHWQSQRLYKEKHATAFKVQECAQGLLTYLSQVHNNEFGDLPKEQKPGIGIVVAGYSKNEFFPEIWRFVVPFDDQVYNQRPDQDGKPDFGASWFGMTEPIVRLHFGRDDRVINIIAEKFGIPGQELFEAIAPLQYPVPFPQMPLQDAIDYAYYMLTVAIGIYRFMLGSELCGGEIDIAAITQREFKWVAQKSLKLE